MQKSRENVENLFLQKRDFDDYIGTFNYKMFPTLQFFIKTVFKKVEKMKFFEKEMVNYDIILDSGRKF